jgi:hypothetical protein
MTVLVDVSITDTVLEGSPRNGTAHVREAAVRSECNIQRCGADGNRVSDGISVRIDDGHLSRRSDRAACRLGQVGNLSVRRT